MRVLSCVAGLGVMLASVGAEASPQDLFGYGPWATSCAGLGQTTADDYTAVHGNPASLSAMRTREVALGFAATGFALTRGGAHAAADRGAATTIGLGLPVPFGGLLRGRVGVGLGFFTPTEIIVRGRVLQPETPQFVNLPDRVQTVALQLGVGVDLGRGFRVGAGVMAMAGLSGAVLVTTDATGRAGSRIDTQLVATYAPVVGLRFDRGAWRAGVVYRGELEARFRVTIDAPDLGVPIPTLDIAGLAQFDPAQVGLEAAWRRGDLTVMAGLTGKRWSAYPGPNAATTPASPAPPAPEFRDTVVPRLAVAWARQWDDGTGLSLRGGVFYEPTPAPLPTAARQYLDNDRLALTAGVGLSARAGGSTLRADTALQVHHLIGREGPGPGGASTTYGGNLVVASVTLGASF